MMRFYAIPSSSIELMPLKNTKIDLQSCSPRSGSPCSGSIELLEEEPGARSLGTRLCIVVMGGA